MTGTMTADSTASFLGAIGGSRFPEYVNPRGVAFVKILGGKQGPSWQFWGTTDTQLRNCNRTLYLNSSFANAAGETVASDTVVYLDGPEKVTPCSFEGMNEFKKAVTHLLESAKNMKGIEAADSLEFMLASLESRGVLNACMKLTRPFFNMKDEPHLLPATRECNALEGSFEFASNPCCNHTLEFSQCCEKKSGVAMKGVLKNVSAPIVNQYCENPGRVVNTIRDFIREQQGQKVDFPDRRSLEEQYEAFRKSSMVGQLCDMC